MAKKTELNAAYQRLCNHIDNENFDTWFDMGLLLDRLRDNRPNRWRHHTPSFNKFKKNLQKGIAFLTFDNGIDGVSIEISKYAIAFERLLKEGRKLPKIHTIAGKYYKEVDIVMLPRWKRFHLVGGAGFDDWDGYMEAFHTKISRGSNEYNILAQKVKEQFIKLAKDLGNYINKENIQLIIPVNACSNPGNIPLAIALVLVSEVMQIPILNSCHDFYWEKGDKPINRPKGSKPQIRDHFFTNYDIGEFFTMVENLYPWDSPAWFHATINTTQSHTLIKKFGMNPLSVGETPTSIDIQKNKPVTKARKKDILRRMELILSRGKEKFVSENAANYVKTDLKWVHNKKPVLLGIRAGIPHSYVQDNFLFLQPTRILKRKRIDKDLLLIEALLGHKPFIKHFKDNPSLHLTLQVTGPATPAHYKHAEEIVGKYIAMIKRLPVNFRERVFLAFSFGTETNKKFEKDKLERILIENVIGVTDLVLLPSEQEGRGLPIIESSACEVPILTNRYDPEEVFSEVVGEFLDKSLRLNVLEFPKKQFDKKTLNAVTELIIDPDSIKPLTAHNREVVKKRYSLEALIRTFDNFLHQIWLCTKVKEESKLTFTKAIEAQERNTKYNSDFHQTIFASNRKYLSGYTILEYMIHLKSLIDPSYFRMEEKETKSQAMAFALSILDRHLVDDEKRHTFLQFLNVVFDYYEGNDKLVVDHSLSYRHRNRRHYPFRKLTDQELLGVIGEGFRKIAPKLPLDKLSETPLKNYKSIMEGTKKLLASTTFKIDDSKRMLEDLESTRPIALLGGNSLESELNLFVLHVLKKRLGIPSGQKLDKKKIQKKKKVGVVTLFISKFASANPSYKSVINWLKNDCAKEINILKEAGLFNIVPTEVFSPGIHLAQLGKEASNELNKIKKKDGFIVSIGDDHMISLDMIDLPSYRIGVAKSNLSCNFLAIKKNDGYIQWVPAGIRPSLSYPTPIQTPKEFHNFLKGSLYQKCVKKYGEKKLLQLIKKDADEYGTPIKVFLQDLMNQENKPNNPKPKKSELPLKSNKLNGLHKDGSPWSGALIQVYMSGQKSSKKLKTPLWDYVTAFADRRGATVLTLIEDFKKKTKKKVSFAWNGGYILNPELVGKLGIGEEFIGSPLGMIIAKSEFLSLPLFNKSTLVFNKDGSISIKRANLYNGFSVRAKDGANIDFTKKDRNLEKSNRPIFYDLMYDKKDIPAKGRIIYRFAGKKIIKKIVGENSSVPLLPTGITVSVPENMELKNWKEGSILDVSIAGWEGVHDAIEAGPLLVKNGKVAINMELGGWKTHNSIATQAARIDYTDMRGPKIAVGINDKNDLIVVAINGRIRESVGATHVDLANIMLKNGAVDAMGFDPGGSVTLIVEGEQLNISPYNKDYELNIYTKPPTPRTVGNAILGILHK